MKNINAVTTPFYTLIEHLFTLKPVWDKTVTFSLKQLRVPAETYAAQGLCPPHPHLPMYDLFPPGSVLSARDRKGTSQACPPVQSAQPPLPSYSLMNKQGSHPSIHPTSRVPASHHFLVLPHRIPFSPWVCRVFSPTGSRHLPGPILPSDCLLKAHSCFRSQCKCRFFQEGLL